MFAGGQWEGNCPNSITISRILGNPSRRIPYRHIRNQTKNITEFDAILFLRTPIVFFIALAKGAHVHHKDVNLCVRFVLDGHDGFFGGVHATDR